MKHPVSQANNNVMVYVDLIGSPAAKHIAQQPQLLGYAKEIIQQEALTLPTMTIEYDMGRIVGHSPVIPTNGKDIVFYARIVRDTVYTRFVKVDKPKQTQCVTLCLQRTDNGTYSLLDIWLGRFYPSRPGSTEETTESREYWLNNAFMFDNQPLQANTITKTCPY